MKDLFDFLKELWEKIGEFLLSNLIKVKNIIDIYSIKNNLFEILSGINIETLLIFLSIVLVGIIIKKKLK